MAEYLSPGVYVEEFESGGRPMEGVSTSTAGLIGLAAKGPVGGIPQLVTNFADFKRKFGGYLSENEFGEYRYLSYAVEHFFINGGSRAFITRVAPKSAKNAVSTNETDIKFIAKNVGTWGNDIRIIVTPGSKARTQALEEISERTYRVKSDVGFNAGDVVALTDGKDKYYNMVEKAQDKIVKFVQEFETDIVDTGIVASKILSTCEFNMDVLYDDIVETYENLSFNIQIPNYILKKVDKSDLINVKVNSMAERIEAPFSIIAGSDEPDSLMINFNKGSNGTVKDLSAADFIGEDNGPGKRTGIQSFIDNDMVSIMAVPGVVDPNVQLMLVAHCENLASRFAVLDMPRELKKVDEVIAHREIFDSHYAALYHPWFIVFDPLDKKNIAIPPSGSILGIYARSDTERGVHKAPANEVVRACVGLDCNYNKGEQDILNPKGVNLVRSFAGQGIRVWGARTASSNSLWKYVNVRRLFIFVEESIKANTNWVVFEPNDEMLWTRVKRTIEVFLTGVWRTGALAGGSSSEAFFVDVGKSTMSQDDIDNGRLICVIGIAPVKPAEFVIFRITQKTASE